MFIGKILFIPETAMPFILLIKIPFWECNKHCFISQEMLKGTGKVIWMVLEKKYLFSFFLLFPLSIFFSFSSLFLFFLYPYFFFGGEGYSYLKSLFICAHPFRDLLNLGMNRFSSCLWSILLHFNEILTNNWLIIFCV